MLDFQQKRKVRSVIYSRITLIVLLLLVLWFIHSTFTVYKKMKESETAKDLSLNDLEKLKDRSDDLRVKIDELDTERGIEGEIRSKFSVAKDNEEMVVILDDVDNVPTPGSKKLTFWQKIRDFFGF
jgi:cell division protein FtsB